MDDLFIGSSIASIGSRGDMSLPAAFCIAIQARAINRSLLVRRHVDAPCVVVYDRARARADHDRYERRATLAGTATERCDTELRRTFGFVAPARLDGRGRIRIAPWMRDRRGERHRALLIGMGDHFEIWDLDEVLDRGTGDIMLLAALHLSPQQIGTECHEPALHPIDPRRGARCAGEPGLPVQSLPAVSPRPDSFRLVEF